MTIFNSTKQEVTKSIDHGEINWVDYYTALRATWPLLVLQQHARESLGPLALSGEVFGCHYLGEAVTGIAWVEAREAAQVHVTPHFNSSAHKKPCQHTSPQSDADHLKCPSTSEPRFFVVGTLMPELGVPRDPPGVHPQRFSIQMPWLMRHICRLGSRCPQDSSGRKSVLLRWESLVKPGDTRTG